MPLKNKSLQSVKNISILQILIIKEKPVMNLPIVILLSSSLSSSLSSLAIADTHSKEAYTTYLEMGIAYNISQPHSVLSSKYGHRVSLYEGQDFSYHIETGVKVPTEDSNTFKIGVYWYDLLPKSGANSLHDPYKFEIFTDYIWEFDDKMYTSVGVGYKILEQTTINYSYEGIKYKISTGDNPVTDKITARFAIGRHFGNYSLSLSHQSQWLKGCPFNNNWEYQVTDLQVSYEF